MSQADCLIFLGMGCQLMWPGFVRPDMLWEMAAAGGAGGLPLGARAVPSGGLWACVLALDM